MKMTALLLLLCACASVTADAPRLDAPQSGRARLYVIRTGTMGALYSWGVMVDGVMIATLPVRSFVGADVPPGDHTLAITFAGGGSTPFPIAALPGATRFVTVSNTGKIAEVDATRGAEFVGRLRPIEPLATVH